VDSLNTVSIYSILVQYSNLRDMLCCYSTVCSNLSVMSSKPNFRHGKLFRDYHVGATNTCTVCVCASHSYSSSNTIAILSPYASSVENTGNRCKVADFGEETEAGLA
jgi:hypothetical protein